MAREHFLFNVFGNYKFNSRWGRKAIALQKKKNPSSLKGSTPLANMCFLMTGKFLVQGKMSLCTNEVILVFTGWPCALEFLLSVPCVVTRCYWKVIPLCIFTAFRACGQRESYLSSPTAKPVQGAPVPGVLSPWLIMTWFALAAGPVLKATFSAH